MTKVNILRGQGVYYIASGAFPLVSMRLFERVTGKKTDRWLVQMVGMLALRSACRSWWEAAGRTHR